MRTKTTILSAVALAAGLLSAGAQVYSANIVGYANVPITGGNAYTMIANPLLGSQGSVKTNGITAAMGASLVGGENLLSWTGSGFYIYNYSPGALAGGFPSDYIDGGGVPIPGRIYNAGSDLYWAPTEPQMPQGKGFFIQNPNSTYTNTFVGEVVKSNTVPIAITGGNAYSLLGAVAPVSGDSTGLTPLLGIPQVGGENTLIWTGSGYYIYNFSPGAYAGGFPSDYIDGGGVPIPGRIYNAGSDLYWAPTTTNGPPAKVGYGFFLQNPNSTYNWVQSLTIQ